MSDLLKLAHDLEMLGLNFRLRHAAYVNWKEGDVIKVMPVGHRLKKHYPSSNIQDDVSVLTDGRGKSDEGVYTGTLGGGQRVTFYGWQVVDHDSKFKSSDKINASLDLLTTRLREKHALTQPLRSQRDYGVEDDTKTSAVDKGAVVRVEAKDNEWLLHFKESYRLKNANLTSFQGHLEELAQKADTVADAITRTEMKVDYDWEHGDQTAATKITAGQGVVQLENVVRLQWNGDVNTVRMREELKSAAEFQGFKVFEY